LFVSYNVNNPSHATCVCMVTPRVYTMDLIWDESANSFLTRASASSHPNMSQVSYTCSSFGSANAHIVPISGDEYDWARSYQMITS
jgi:hypothetical protein